MNTIAVFLGGLSVVLFFFLFLFIPGFALSLVIFPRTNDLRIIDRLVYSIVLSISSSIALMLFMEVVLKLDTTLVNITLIVGIFSELLLMVWLCERWYLNNRLKKRLEPRIPADDKVPRELYTRETTAAQDRSRQGTRPVVSRDIPGQPVGSPLPEYEWSYIETGGRVRVPEVPGRVEPKGIPTHQNVQPRVPSMESLKHEENTIVIESIRKLQKDILRDQDMFDVLPASLKRSGKNIENIRIPKKSDINKKLSDVKDELKDLDWLYK